MVRAARQAHWLRHNKAARYPRRVICIDCESLRDRTALGETHTFRLAAATLDRLDGDRVTGHDEGSFVTTADLWAWVDARCIASHRTVLFAHNLAYDLRISDGLRRLTDLGWTVEALALDRYRTWLRLKHGRRALTMVDSVSFLGLSLATLAEQAGYPYVTLPPDDAPTQAHLLRCQSDTALLRDLVLRMLRWLRANDAGNFRLTGPAQGTALFRHRFLNGHGLLVHDDEEQLARERDAAWTGRCEVWRHGEIGGPLYEWDFSLCYARVARDALLPTRLRGVVQSPANVARSAARDSVRILADVSLRTETPVVPARDANRIVWPVGSFQTTLWDCEIDLARESGAEITVDRAWTYHAAPLLREWAEWIIEAIEGDAPERDPVARAMLKQWSRSTVGRFGLRYPVWEPQSPARTFGFGITPWIDAESRLTGATLQVGRQILDRSGVIESSDSAPAIMSYVMALARCRLWHAMQAVPRDALVYVDTDSVIVTADGHAALAAFAATPEGEGLRVKHVHPHGRFYAPRQIALGDALRISGLPRGALPLGDGRYRAVVWEGAEQSLKRRQPASVLISERTIQIRGSDERRSHLAGSETAAKVIHRPESENGSQSLNATVCIASERGGE